MRPTLTLALALACAAPAHAGVVLARVKGAQVDEAVGAFKSTWRDPVKEIVVDESTDVAALNAQLAPGDVIVGVGARAAQLALKQGSAPVIHCMVLQGAKGFDGPRSAGVPLVVPALAQLKALKQLAPRSRTVGVVYDTKLNADFIEELRAAARATGITVDARAVTSAKDAAGAMDALLGAVDAVLIVPDATVVTKDLLSFVALRSIERRVPVFGYSEALVKLGMFAALASDYSQNGALCAQLARRVVNGEAPAQLHGVVQMPGTLVVHAGVARRIGLTLPAEVLRAPTIVVGQ